MTKSMQGSGPRVRTRAAIVSAAAHVFSRDATASLNDVAVAADVTRSTVHRYFPEREDLLAALDVWAIEQVQTAVERARIDEGAPRAALRRLVDEIFDLGPAVSYVYYSPLSGKTQDDWRSDTEPISDLLLRCAADDPLPAFSHRAFWAVIEAAWDTQMYESASRYDLVSAIMRCIGQGILPEPA